MHATTRSQEYPQHCVAVCGSNLNAAFDALAFLMMPTLLRGTDRGGAEGAPVVVTAT